MQAIVWLVLLVLIVGAAFYLLFPPDREEREEPGDPGDAGDDRDDGTPAGR